MSRAVRRSRRGLGLAEALLAVAALAAAAYWGTGVLGEMAARHLLGREARAVSAAALATRLWVEGDPAARAPTGPAPVAVTFAQLRTEGLWGVATPETTPGRRRDMTIWLWRQSAARTLVFVRARGEAANIPPGIPGASDSAAAVGVIPDVAGETAIRGADVLFDTTDVVSAPAGWAGRGDMFAIESVRTDPAGCTPFLHREPVPGCAVANTMAADFTVAGDFSSDGDLTVGGDAGVTGALDVAGGLTVDGGLLSTSASEAVEVLASMSVGQNLDVAGSLVVSGSITAASVSAGGSVVCTGGG